MMQGLVNYVKCLLRLPGCREVHRLLFEYVSGTLPPDKHAKLTAHLRDCPLCLEYVETYRITVQSCKEACQPDEPMPPELEAKLLEFIRKEL